MTDTKNPKNPKNKEESDMIENMSAPDINIEKAIEMGKEHHKEEIKSEIESQVQEDPEFVEMIENEEEFLDFFNEDRYNIEFQYDRGDGNKKIIKCKVRPIEPGDQLEYTNLSTLPYQDFTKYEKGILEKVEKDTILNKTEKKALEKLNEKTIKYMKPQLDNMIIELLADFVTPPDFNGDKNKRREFWKKADYVMRTELGDKVMQVLGIDHKSNVSFL